MFPNQLENQITNNLGLSNPQLARFCKKWGIIELSLFGSILGDQFNQNSDIDILLQFSPDSRQGLLTLAKIKYELEKMTGRVIDIAVKESIENSENEIRRQEILNTAKVIYAQR
ncbi:MAG: nucleotidyltransferase family protein [Crocosphaera sp.]